MGFLEVQPAQTATGEHVVEMHAHPHETRCRPRRQLFLGKPVALRERIDPSLPLDESPIHGGTRQCVEVPHDEEAVALALLFDESHQVLRFSKLILAPTESARLGPERARQRGRQAQVRVEDVDGAVRVFGMVAKADVRTNARLLEAPDRVRLAMGNVVRHFRVVMVDLEVPVGEDREPGRVHVGSRRKPVGVRRKIVSLVGVRLADRRERAGKHLGEALELCVFPPMGDRRAQRSRFHLLQANDTRRRLQRGNRLGDATHCRPSAGQTTRGVTEVTDVVTENADRLHAGSTKGFTRLALPWLPEQPGTGFCLPCKGCGMQRPRETALDASDLREGGAWTHLQRAKNQALWSIAALSLESTRRLPMPLLLRLGRALGAAAHLVAVRARHIALSNVAMVFPELDDRQRRAFVRRNFETLGELLGETIALMKPRGGPPPLPLSDEARRLLGETGGERQGIVFASAHLGPWERVAASLVSAGVPLVTVARESYDPRFSRMYEALRSAQGVRVVWRGTPGAALRIVRTLRSGGVLGVPMDLRARVPSLDAPFLGRPAPTATGAARLALRTGAAVVVGTAAPARPPLRKNATSPPPDRTETADLVITATRIPTKDLPPGLSGVIELTSRINRELSHRILALPHSWPWMHERWRTETGV